MSYCTFLRFWCNSKRWSRIFKPCRFRSVLSLSLNCQAHCMLGLVEVCGIAEHIGVEIPPLGSMVWWSESFISWKLANYDRLRQIDVHIVKLCKTWCVNNNHESLYKLVLQTLTFRVEDIWSVFLRRYIGAIRRCALRRWALDTKRGGALPVARGWVINWLKGIEGEMDMSLCVSAEYKFEHNLNIIWIFVFLVRE